MNWAGRKVVITGGAGFIGSHLARQLVRKGARVTVVDNFSTGRIENLHDIRGEIELVAASTIEETRLRRVMRDVDTVFHLAAVLGVKRTWEEPVRVIHENIQGTHIVLRLAAEAGARHVVLASSSEVYGDGEPPYSEATPPEPRTGYAAAKLVEEKLAEGFTAETGLATTCMRYFNVYGPGQESSAYGFVTAIFCDRIQAGQPPIVFGDGEQTRDFTFVEDTVAGTIMAAERDAGHEVLNLGTGVETSVNDLARAVIQASGRTDLRIKYEPPRRDEVRRRLADATRAHDMGWHARVSLQDGLRRTLVALKTQQVAKERHGAEA